MFRWRPCQGLAVLCLRPVHRNLGGMSDLSERIEAALRARYPDGLMPYGAQKAVALEVDATSEWVRQVANGMGMRRAPRSPKRPVCRQCGAPRAPAAQYCEDCQFVPRGCSWATALSRDKPVETGNWRGFEEPVAWAVLEPVRVSVS